MRSLLLVVTKARQGSLGILIPLLRRLALLEDSLQERLANHIIEGFDHFELSL